MDWMTTDNDSIEPTIQVQASAAFQKNLRILNKRYRSLRHEVATLIEQLQSGELPGDQIPNIGYDVYKVRIRNRDAQKGKSGGFRAIYYVKRPTSLLLITLYSKSDQGDVTAEEIRAIISTAETGSSD
jgi:mRNA-degrading endonuclease RelE of RelBE toxin-antitoxin system